MAVDSYTISLLFLYFFVYSVLGWCCEVAFCSIPAGHFINRGFLNGPYCPIYGTGALIVVATLQPYIHEPSAVFIIGMVSTSIVEYISSWLMEVTFHARWWDYSQNMFNLHGRVCLMNSTLFGIMTLVVIYIVHPVVSGLFAAMTHATTVLCAEIIGSLMILDLIVSTGEAHNFQNKVNRVSELATTVTQDAKVKGIDTKGELIRHLSNTRTLTLEKIEEAKAHAESAQHHVDAFTRSVRENSAFRRYSHRRLSGAFPTMSKVGDPAAHNLYRAALMRDHHYHKLVKRQSKISRKDARHPSGRK